MILIYNKFKAYVIIDLLQRIPQNCMDMETKLEVNYDRFFAF